MRSGLCAVFTPHDIDTYVIYAVYAFFSVVLLPELSDLDVDGAMCRLWRPGNAYMYTYDICI